MTARSTAPRSSPVLLSGRSLTVVAAGAAAVAMLGLIDPALRMVGVAGAAIAAAAAVAGRRREAT